MITLNNIECADGFAYIKKSQCPFEWGGRVLFLVPQTLQNVEHVDKYSGPLFGCEGDEDSCYLCLLPAQLYKRKLQVMQ